MPISHPGVLDKRTGQRLLRTVVVSLLLVSIASGSFSVSVSAASDPVLITAAQGLVELGSAAPVWSAGQLELDEGESVADPAGDAPGFLLVTDGDVVVESGSTGQRTLVRTAAALFVSANAGATFTAIDDDAELWRFAVVADGSATPIDEDDVERLVESRGEDDPNAEGDAVRAIEIRIGVLSEGDEASIGDDEESVAFGCSIEGRYDLGDDSVRQGRCEPAPASGRDSEVTLVSDDDDVLAAIVVAGPSLDPDSLAATNRRDDASDDQPDTPKPSPTPQPADPGNGNDGGGNDDGNGQPPPEEEPDLTDLDTDGDDLNDQFEIDNGTDPTKADSDDDGLTDRQEVIELQLNTDPNNPDTDGDGLTDGDEVNMVTGFFTRPDNPDTDGDGLPDAAELNVGANPNLPDTDSDGLTDLQEASLGCNPQLADTDADGIPDLIETNQGSSCLVPNF